MRTIGLLSITASILLFVCSTMCVAEGQSIYREPVPQTLDAQIASETDWCKRHFPISEDAKKAIEKTLGEFDLSKNETMAPIREKILQVGPGAIPVVAKELSSQDDSVRDKTIFALRMLIRSGEGSPNTTEADPLLTALFRRSLLDRSTRVRQSTIVGLSKLGFKRKADIPEEIRLGFREAMHDPDRVLSNMAKEYWELIDRRSRE